MVEQVLGNARNLRPGQHGVASPWSLGRLAQRPEAPGAPHAGGVIHSSPVSAPASLSLGLPEGGATSLAAAAGAAVQPIPALTSVRGLAAWWVVLFHFVPDLLAVAPPALIRFANQGYLAVDLFFQLSGLVIALNYAPQFRRFEWNRFRRFLALRLARIYPLHLVALCLFLINPIAIDLFSAQGETGGRYDPAYFLLSLLLVQNWGLTSVLAWNVPAWSISTEWFAYLAFPFLVLLANRGARGLFSTLACLAVLLGALAALAPPIGLGGDIPGFGLLRCVLGFGIGVLICRLHALRQGRARAESDLCVLLALGCFGAYAVLPLPDSLIMPLGFLLLIFGLADNAALASRLLRWPVLESIGLVSYSTYLIHYFVKDWVKFLLVRPEVPEAVPVLAYLLVTALASVLLYRLVEVPGRRALRRFA
ncbi:acyltransferase family protein [Roseomonas sp. BN140053]|uniref:acyltransferase family protein n=1 Tax=Roseomonas sp. BN140053 TaxID=3391898 RepID=UPI0039EC6FCA